MNLPPHTPTPSADDASADAQMMQTVDELAERTVEADAMRARVDELAAALADEQAKSEQLLRAAADAQNRVRRADADRPRVQAEVRASTLRPVLAVLDDLYRALAAAATATDPAAVALRDGVEAVVRNFEGALQTLGAAPIVALGQPFDPHLHEALMNQPAPAGTAPGTVVAEFRRGYRLGDQVLRHSQVAVAA